MLLNFADRHGHSLLLLRHSQSEVYFQRSGRLGSEYHGYHGAKSSLDARVPSRRLVDKSTIGNDKYNTWHGNGRKAGWYSPFLMACYNPGLEEFQSVCRVMSGISDSFYTEMKEFYSEDRILSKKPPYYQTGEQPDMWFIPELVWEIRGAEFTISPVHHATTGLVHPFSKIHSLQAR